MRVLLCLTTVSFAALALAGCSSSDDPMTSTDSGVRTDAGVTGTPDSGITGTPDSGVAQQPDSGVVQPDSGVVPPDSGVVQPTPLGCRAVNVKTGEDGDGPNNSVFFTTAFGSADTDLSEFIDAKGWQVGGALTLCAGPIEAGKAGLTLQSDVTFAVSLPLDNCLCRTYPIANTHR